VQLTIGHFDYNMAHSDHHSNSFHYWAPIAKRASTLTTTTMPLPRTLQPGYYGKASAVVSQNLEDYVDGEPKGEIHRLAIASDALMTHPRTDPSTWSATTVGICS